MQSDVALTGLLAQAAACVRGGRIDDGIALYEQALAVRADLPDAWFNLAWLQGAARRFDAALASYGQAIAYGVARPEEAHLACATILSEHLADLAAARRALDVALALNPRFVPAWLNLGHICEDIGDTEGALRAYGHVVAEEPGNGRAHARIAAIDIVLGQAARATVALEAALPQLASVDDRADVLFALGTALDAQARYDDAFDAFEAGNTLSRSLERTRYDPGAHERLVDRIIATPFAPVPLQAADAPRPVFVCGMFRSGSTLAEQMLGRHPMIEAAGERDTIPALVHRLGAGYPENWRDAAALPGDDIDAGKASVVIDKRCDNFLHIGLIKSLYPRAKFIHTHRDALDNIVSLYFLRFGEAVSYAGRLSDIAHYYGRYRRLMGRWRELYGDDIHDLDYDRLVVDPRPTLASALDFLGLDWDERVLAAETDARAVRTASAWQVRQPLHGRSSGRWRHYERHLDEVCRLLN